LDRALLQASAKRGCETLPRPTTWGRAITGPSPSKPCPDLRCSSLLLDTHPVMAPSPWTNTIVLLIVVPAYLIFSRDSGSNPEVLAPPARLSLHSTPLHCLSLDVSRKLGRRCAAEDGAARFLFSARTDNTFSCSSFPVVISIVLLSYALIPSGIHNVPEIRFPPTRPSRRS
jgi:hypothetical protein